MPLISSTHIITHMRQPYERWVYVSWLCVFKQWLVVQDCIYFHNSFYNLIIKYTWFLHNSVPPPFKMWCTLHMGHRGFKCDTNTFLSQFWTSQPNLCTCAPYSGGSNSYLKDFHGLQQSLQLHAGIIPPFRPRLLPSLSFPIHLVLIILSLSAILRHWQQCSIHHKE